MSGDAREALDALDPGAMTREVWIRVAFAAKDAGITESEFVEWCERGDNFDRSDAISTFRNAKPRAGGVTAATLYMLARDAGYKPEGKRGNGANGEAQPAPKPVARPPREPEPPPTDPLPVWEACRPVDVHGYLARKRIKAHGARVNSTGWLVVPYLDRDGRLQTLQNISVDGTKRFLTGARAKGSVAVMGEPKGAAKIAIAEGFATAAAIEESTGTPTLAAGSRVSFPEAARIARYLAPQARLIIAADRGDLSTPLAAARAVGGFLAVPGPEDAPEGFDFADWRLSGASDAEIGARLDHATPVEPPPEPPKETKPAKRETNRSIRETPEPERDTPAPMGPYYVDAKGKAHANLANVITYLESGRAGDLKRDTFTGLTTWRGVPFDDASYVELTRELQGAVIDGRRPFLKLAVSMVADALLATVKANSFNSCVDWLDTLPAWDKVERCPSFFADVCGLDPTDYLLGVGRYFWSGMLSRMVTPGAQVDASVALIGEQGIGKTSLAKIIGAERYGEAGLVGIGERDWVAPLRGKIIVEISELSGHTRAELETIKAILSRSFDEYRAPYARTASTIPRGNVFCATTNESQFLIDASGNRRWLPIVCRGAIALDNVASMRELYFAEAYARVREGLPALWHVVPDAATHQAEHVARDPWIDLLAERLPSDLGDMPASIANTLVYELLKLPADRQTGATGRRIAAVMRALGYRRASWYLDSGRGRRVRGYDRDPDLGNADR